MEKETRSAIERATQRGRKILEKDFSEQLESPYDVLVKEGRKEPKAGVHLVREQDRVLRDRISAAIDHKVSLGMSMAEAIRDYLRECAFTTLNRFVALKMLEARGLILASITRGVESAGYRELCGFAPELSQVPGGYRHYIESVFDELSTEVKVLFDRRDPASILWPRGGAFEELLAELNAPALAGVWTEDETIGWVYQYFNSGEERSEMRKASQAPRNSRELAVRNQFFTPRYVVRFLVDNTLGRMWLDMQRGKSRVSEFCEYLVRRPHEVFFTEYARQWDGAFPDWLRQASRGDFAALPESVDEDGLSKLSLFVNGHDEAMALGYGDLVDWARPRWEALDKAGELPTTSIDCWLLMFATQRSWRNATGSGPPDARTMELWQQVYRQLRALLQRDDYTQAELLAQAYFIPYRPRKDPRELKILDPACGSGHFLLYAFDVLQVVYEEAFEKGRLRSDYADLDALRRALPGLILRNNLHGIDIDPRAAQIAALALWMRAQRAYADAKVPLRDRPIITKTNIVVAEPMPGDDMMVHEFATTLSPPLLGDLFKEMVAEMKLAGEMGSLLKIEEAVASAVKTARDVYVEGKRQGKQFRLELGPNEMAKQGQIDLSGITDEAFFHTAEGLLVDALMRYANTSAGETGVRRRLFAEDAVHGIALIELLRDFYWVVLMNPPFGVCSAGSKKQFEASFPRSSMDLFAGFVERGIGLLHPSGKLGAITSRTGFFLSSFQTWREEVLLAQGLPTVFADLGMGVLDAAMVEVAAYCIEAA